MKNSLPDRKMHECEKIKISYLKLLWCPAKRIRIRKTFSIKKNFDRN